MLAARDQTERAKIQPDIIGEHGEISAVAQRLNEFSWQRDDCLRGVQESEDRRNRLCLDDVERHWQVPLLEYSGEPLA